MKAFVSAIKRKPFLLFLAVLVLTATVTAGSLMTDYFQTLTSGDTITVTGAGCKVEVVSSDGNEIVIKCFESKTKAR